MIGQSLSHYKVLEKIGSGGMGVVYLARDTKLDRDVAIKVLPEVFSQNKERLARFEREAKLLASLNHPNIAAIHEIEESDGVTFLVLELVPGETLAERISRGSIPVDEALPLFVQIAEGLEAAHEKGIIHRDLKPSNIKVTPENKVKILDFGLAKAMAEDAPAQALSESPTLTRDATETGVLLGTAPYMSPEQARGKAVDKRTDIWAFGCCLYEALTGKVAFLGEMVSDTIVAVIGKEPDWEKLPSKTNASIRRLLQRCLQKEPNRRLRDVWDARIEIEEALSDPSLSAAPEEAGRDRSTGPFVLIALTALIVGGAVTWSLTRSTPPMPRQVTRATIPLPPEREIRFGALPQVAISPDGKHIAYIARHGNSSRLHLRAMDRLTAAPIDGTESARMPFFSPDGQWVGFHVQPSGQLMKVSISGGAPVVIATIGINIRGASWAPDGTIVLNSHANTGLSRIRSDGGGPEVLTTPDRERGEKTHRLPEVLPGGKAVLFTIGTGNIMSFDDASIAILSLETGKYRVILEGGMNARYSETGHLIYARAGSLLAVPFDLDDLQVKGVPVPILKGITSSLTYGVAEFSVSRNGSLAYVPGSSWEEKNRVFWIDREGHAQPIIETPRTYYGPKLSPDGRSLALGIEGANNTVWAYDLARETLTRLSFGFDADDPIWTRDGRRLTFAFDPEGVWNIFWQDAGGSGQVERLTTSEYVQIPKTWSPDGKVLAYNQAHPETGVDIWTLPSNRKPEPFLCTEFNERDAMFSPNGRWIAYASDESGQSEVYVRPFPVSQGKHQVSTEGGEYPVWNPNGKELFYRDGDKMTAVDVRTEGELVLGKPKLLFEVPSLRLNYDVALDGRRFVMIEHLQSRPASDQLIFVQNWSEELKRLVPTN